MRTLIRLFTDTCLDMVVFGGPCSEPAERREQEERGA